MLFKQRFLLVNNSIFIVCLHWAINNENKRSKLFKKNFCRDIIICSNLVNCAVIAANSRFNFSYHLMQTRKKEFFFGGTLVESTKIMETEWIMSMSKNSFKRSILIEFWHTDDILINFKGFFSCAHEKWYQAVHTTSFEKKCRKVCLFRLFFYINEGILRTIEKKPSGYWILFFFSIYATIQVDLIFKFVLQHF